MTTPSISLLESTTVPNQHNELIKDFKEALFSSSIAHIKMLGQEILEKVGHFNLQDKQERPILSHVFSTHKYLSFDDRMERLTYLLEHGADPTLTDLEGNTALHMLFWSSIYTDEIKKGINVLMKHGGSLMEKNKKGDAPQHIVFKNKKRFKKGRDIIQMLIKKGIDLNAAGYRGNTMLHQVVRHGDFSDMFFLLDHRAHVDPVNEVGNSPLHLASFYGDLDMVHLLVHHGANVNLPGQNCETPLFSAFKKGHTLIFKHLLKHGASLVALDEKGEDLFVKTISPKPALQVFYEKQKYDRSFPQNSKKTQKSRL